MIRNKYSLPLILGGLFWAFIITVLRAFRWPNDWAEAHWLISYEFGFIKRALAGTLISPFTNYGDINSNAYLAIKIVSTSFLLFFCLAIFWVCFRIIKKFQFNIHSVLISSIFLTCPYIVMSSHLNGYFDNIIILISVFASALVMRGKIWSSAILLSIGILIHETTFLVGFPSVIFVALIQQMRISGVHGFLRMFVDFIYRYKLLFLMPLLIFAGIFINQTLFIDAAMIRKELVAHLSQFDFVQARRNLYVPDAFTTSFIDYLTRQSPAFFNRITAQIHVVHIGLPLLVIWGYCWHRLRGAAFRKTIFFVLVLISVLPLSLHLIAWDTSRIWTYPLVVAMLGLWGISETFPVEERTERDSLFFSIIFLMVMMTQLFIFTPLMDGVREQYANESRVLLYSPLLLLIALFFSQYYSPNRVDRSERSAVQIKPTGQHSYSINQPAGDINKIL
ncbi:MAG: hypothetical protein HRU20_01340 [Pseudomonadales bacterium]|nr:hypothetical protein [Pseudomonadales bacterium]